MACLHNEYRKDSTGFNGKVKLTSSRKDELNANRRALRNKIRNWFKENKPNELQPKFYGQGSIEMNTTVNPIPTYDQTGKKQTDYDLDDGIYFIEKEGENNRKSINTWHNWVYEAVKDHTTKGAIDKKTCVRVLYEDGHHIDLPIYYKKDNDFELAHKTKGWLISDPKKFSEWFNDKAKENQQLRRIVRYLKAWKNYRENKNTSFKLASGFSLTILATNNYFKADEDDYAFRETIRSIHNSLKSNFECLRPTTPIGEDVFIDFSETKRKNFMDTLESLLKDCDKARDEDNFKKASEILRENQFGDRFPLGQDKSEKEEKAAALRSRHQNSEIKPIPYYG